MTHCVVELVGVSKHFRKGSEVIRAVSGVTFQVGAGEFISIQGPSGCGKTTLLHLLGALDVPSEGAVLLAGQDITRLSDQALSRIRSRNIGFVFQAFNLIPDLDVLQNVALPLKYAGVSSKQREQQAREALQAVGLAHRLNHRPSELSGGEEQRVAVARALVNRPQLILADEPTGNLDSRNREGVLNLFRDLNRAGQTIVVVTHDPAVAEAAGRRMFMKDGQFVAAHTHADFAPA